jgi:hypothetical protein
MRKRPMPSYDTGSDGLVAGAARPDVRPLPAVPVRRTT